MKEKFPKEALVFEVLKDRPHCTTFVEGEIVELCWYPEPNGLLCLLWSPRYTRAFVPGDRIFYLPNEYVRPLTPAATEVWNAYRDATSTAGPATPVMRCRHEGDTYGHDDGDDS